VNIKSRIERLEDAAGMDASPGPRRRLMELIAVGTLRLQRRPELAVTKAADAALLSIIGTAAEGFDRAISDLPPWWRNGGREQMIAAGYEVRHFNL
jgi:hypothetical protein